MEENHTVFRSLLLVSYSLPYVIQAFYHFLIELRNGLKRFFSPIMLNIKNFYSDQSLKISSFFILFLYVLVGAPTHAHAIKQLRLSFPVAETGFDPAKVHDAYSGAVVEAL